MKQVETKVSIGSDQLKPEFFNAILSLDDASKSGVVNGVKYTGPTGLKPEHAKKDNRVTVALGTIKVSVPTTKQDVLELLATDEQMVIDTLATQLVTNAANAHRKSFTKDGDAKINLERMNKTRAWLFTPAGQPFAAEYQTVLAKNDAKVEKEWLLQKFDEHLSDE
jgi:hypothetical protein